MSRNDEELDMKRYTGKIYRIKGQICSFQEKLDNSPKKAILHDYMMLKDGDCMKLVCRSCGFVNFSWKDIFKGNYGY